MEIEITNSNNFSYTLFKRILDKYPAWDFYIDDIDYDDYDNKDTDNDYDWELSRSTHGEIYVVYPSRDLSQEDLIMLTLAGVKDKMKLIEFTDFADGQ